MLTVATLLWSANRHSLPFSRHYTELDADKLFRGFARHLTAPFRFVCFSERERAFAEPIKQERLTATTPDYHSCLEPYRLDAPMILVGLDTVVVGNCDALAGYCLRATKPAYPLDPYKPARICNGVSLVPAGHAWIWRDAQAGVNDMDRVRGIEHSVIDEVFPRQVVSYKCQVKAHGTPLPDARIVYFHGEEKPHQIADGWLREHWI